MVTGSVFEAHELSNLVSVIASASLKESIRLAALQQVHTMFTEYDCCLSMRLSM